MSKKITSAEQSFTKYDASYRLAAGDRITFYCSNVVSGSGNVIGKTITNTFGTTMMVLYSEPDQSLILVSLSGDGVEF